MRKRHCVGTYISTDRVLVLCEISGPRRKCDVGQGDSARGTRAPAPNKTRPSRKLHRHELRRLLAHVGDSVRVAAGRPLDVARFDVYGRGALAFNIAAYLDIRDRDYQVRPVVPVAWNDSPGLELEFGNAGIILAAMTGFGRRCLRRDIRFK